MCAGRLASDSPRLPPSFSCIAGYLIQVILACLFIQYVYTLYFLGLWRRWPMGQALLFHCWIHSWLLVWSYSEKPSEFKWILSLYRKFDCLILTRHSSPLWCMLHADLSLSTSQSGNRFISKCLPIWVKFCERLFHSYWFIFNQLCGYFCYCCLSCPRIPVMYVEAGPDLPKKVRKFLASG